MGMLQQEQGIWLEMMGGWKEINTRLEPVRVSRSFPSSWTRTRNIQPDLQRNGSDQSMNEAKARAEPSQWQDIKTATLSIQPEFEQFGKERAQMSVL